MAESNSQITQLFLESVQRLTPIISSSADAAESNRELPANLLEALHQESLFRLLLPKLYGGFELRPASFCKIIEAIATIDASTAWCLCQANGCAMAAAFLPKHVANEIWAEDKKGVLAWGPGTGKAIRQGNHFRLTGRWSFVSGGRHASWIGGHALVKDENGDTCMDPTGRPMSRTFLFPSTRAEMKEAWDVIGLLGTGSDQFAVSDISVPATHMLARDEPSQRNYDEPLYYFPAASLYASGFAGVALGIARAMFDSFKLLVSTKTPRLEQQKLNENPVIQSEVAQSQARLNSARVYLLSELEEIWDSVCNNKELAVEDRIRIRLASTYAIHEARSVVNAVYAAAGASAIFSNSPFQRQFRDLHTVAQQIQGRKSHFQAVGSFLLGQPPDLTMA